MAAVVSCFAERLTADVWARMVAKVPPSGPYRKVARIQRYVTYGNPELLVVFTDGTTTRCAPNAVWEIEEPS